MRTTLWMAGMLSATILLAWAGGASGSLVISIEPPVTQADLGDTVEIAVHADGPDSAGWYWLQILTDESVITYDSCSTEILQGCPSGWNCMRCGPTGEPGVFEADCACFGQHSCVGIPGDLIIIRYIATGYGISPVSFQFVYVSDCDRVMIPLDAIADGTVEVGDASVGRGEGHLDYSLGSFTGFPNPFRRDVTLQFQLPLPEGGQRDRQTESEIRIFDCLGRQIRSFQFTLSPGEHAITWDGLDRKGRDVPSGVYFCRYPVEGGVGTYKITRVD